jgi:hypothetical protein
LVGQSHHTEGEEARRIREVHVLSMRDLFEVLLTDAENRK